MSTQPDNYDYTSMTTVARDYAAPCRLTNWNHFVIPRLDTCPDLSMSPIGTTAVRPCGKTKLFHILENICDRFRIARIGEGAEAPWYDKTDAKVIKCYDYECRIKEDWVRGKREAPQPSLAPQREDRRPLGCCWRGEKKNIKKCNMWFRWSRFAM